MKKIFDSDGDGFDREEFLLKTFLGLMLAQYIVRAGQLGVCSYSGVYSLRAGVSNPNAPSHEHCEQMTTRLKETFDLSVTTILALLGGAGLGSAMQQRRSAKQPPRILHTTEHPIGTITPPPTPPRRDDGGPDGGGLRMR